MMDLRNEIEQPNYRNKLVKHNQTTIDIAKLMLKCENDSRNSVGKIAKYFNGATDLEKCKRVWYYLRKYIEYKKEPPEKQTGKTISRIVFDGFGDCKHYSIFAVGVLKYLKVPVRFRLVSFSANRKSPTHAYCVANVNGREIIIDACIENFNEESNYNYKFDVSPIK